MGTAKTIFITGAGSGIGLATTLRFLESGWNVGALDVSAEHLRTALPDGNPHLLSIVGDTTDRAALQTAVDTVARHFSSIDAAFANAGIHQVNTLMNISDDALDAIIDVNIKGTINTLRAVVPHLQATGGGAIVINASDQSLIGKRSSFGYGLSKGALGQMTRSLALDLGAFGIRVNAVCPGTIRTPLAEGAFRTFMADTPGFDLEEAFRGEAAQYPLQRIGTARDVAGLVHFLCGTEASFLTGALCPIDGGLTAG